MGFASLSLQEPDPLNCARDMDPSSQRVNLVFRGRTVRPLPRRVEVPPPRPTDSYLANDERLISATREALAVLPSSPTPPFVTPAPSISSAQIGSSTVSTGRNKRRLAAHYA